MNAFAEPGSSLPGADHWPLERLRLADNRQYEGLIESEDELWVHLIQILRPAGKPMHLVIRPIDRDSITSISRLPPEERAQLRQKIDQFLNRAVIEAGRLDAVRLVAAEVNGQSVQKYEGRWFRLESTADAATTRRVIVQTEQVFTAYRQALAPRTQANRTLRIAVFGSLEQYQTELARRGVTIAGRACFLEQENLVLAGSEVARYAAQLARINASHDRIRRELDQLEQRLKQRLQEIGKLLREQNANRNEIVPLLRREQRQVEQELKKKRDELARADRENAQIVQKALGRTFTRLYHEAFHAYLENYVFPHRSHDVPLWLNEGLAVLFEGGLLESDVLRIDAPNAAMLRPLKADLSGPRPLALADLLTAGAQDFLLPPDAPAAAAGRHYLYSWGLVYYLAFEKRLLSSPALDQYVRPAARQTPPVKRFERLLGEPLPELEKQWRQYMMKRPL